MYTSFGTRIPDGLDGYNQGYDGLSGNIFKKLLNPIAHTKTAIKTTKKVAKNKTVQKVVKGAAIAAAAYYTGGAALKLLKNGKAAKAAKGVSSVIGKTAKKKAKKGRIVKDPFTGQPVNYDDLNPAMQDRVLMQQGSHVNSNGVPFANRDNYEASQKIDIPQTAPLETYAKAALQKADQYFPNSSQEFSPTPTPQEYGSPAAGSFFADPKMLAITAGVVALFFITAKKS